MSFFFIFFLNIAFVNIFMLHLSGVATP